MDTSRLNTREPGRHETRDLLVDYDPTPPPSPQSPRLSEDLRPGQFNMQSYSYHKGHQSLDNARSDWRFGVSGGAHGAKGVRTAVTGVSASDWGMPGRQRDPRFTQWRPESISNRPMTEDLRLLSNGSASNATAIASRSYAYCLDRGNGNVTRLIPADMLPPLNEIRRWEPERPGMVVLPLPSAPAPTGVAATNQSVTLQTTNSTNGATTSLGSGNRRPATTSPHKRGKEKVYCTKWIHDGNCAFEWTGCRFKHVMPMDKETQMHLGLFNGLPAWWKKKQTQGTRQQARLNMERLRLDDEPQVEAANGLAGSVPDVRQHGGFAGSPSSYGRVSTEYKPGPIAPPRKSQ